MEKSANAKSPVSHMKEDHIKMKKQIEKINMVYTLRDYRRWWLQSFAKGDIVYTYLRNERFLIGSYNEVRLKEIGPCKIFKNILNNAYVL